MSWLHLYLMYFLVFNIHCYDVIFKIDLYSNRIMYYTQMKSILYNQNFMIVKTHSSFSHNIIVRKKKERVGNEWKAYFDNILLEYEIGFMPIFNKKSFCWKRSNIWDLYNFALFIIIMCFENYHFPMYNFFLSFFYYKHEKNNISHLNIFLSQYTKGEFDAWRIST